MGITPESQAKLEVIAPPSAMLEAFKHCKYTNNLQINKKNPTHLQSASCAGFQLFSNFNYFNYLFSTPLRTLPFVSKVCR